MENGLLQTFASDFIELMNNAYDFMKYGHSSLNISTMTLVCCTNKEYIDMEKFVEHFEVVKGDFNAVLKKKNRHDKPTITKRGKVKKNFFNQATITYRDNTTKSIKVFTNGKLQMTGITSLIEGLRVAHKICDIVSECTNTKIIVTNVRIAMINSDFCIRKNVNLHRFQCDIEDRNIDCGYDPDTYPGLKVKYKGVSIFIFSTGSVVITGSKSLKELQDAFLFISTMVVRSESTFGTTKEKDKKPEYVDGYPKHLLECCVTKFSV